MQIPIHEVSLTVTYKTLRGDKKRDVTLIISDRVPLASGISREDIIRKSIDALSGIQRQVMSDLYRHLILGNYSQYNGFRGKAAEPVLNNHYPNSETLQDFELKSGQFNSSGLIVYNLLKHPESDKTGYRILGGILLSLLDENVFDPPRLEDRNEFSLPEEISEFETYREGAVRRILVNSYERDIAARKKCINHYGTKCCVCRFDFFEAYGEIGRGFLHVHHMRPLSEIGAEYQVAPIKDLRPVCPNCHAMIHMSAALYSIEEMQALLHEHSPKKLG